jgi:hypothetical protein
VGGDEGHAERGGNAAQRDLVDLDVPALARSQAGSSVR